MWADSAGDHCLFANAPRDKGKTKEPGNTRLRIGNRSEDCALLIQRSRIINGRCLFFCSAKGPLVDKVSVVAWRAFAGLARGGGRDLGYRLPLTIAPPLQVPLATRP